MQRESTAPVEITDGDEYADQLCQELGLAKAKQAEVEGEEGWMTEAGTSGAGDISGSGQLLGDVETIVDDRVEESQMAIY